MRVPLLNFERGPGILLLNFEGGHGVPLLNFRGSWVPLLNFEGGFGSRVPGPGSWFHFYTIPFKSTYFEEHLRSVASVIVTLPTFSRHVYCILTSQIFKPVFKKLISLIP